jgi:magnesium-transporting ATPase (P-type)
MTSTYQKKSLCAIVLSLAVFGLSIAAVSTYWYFWFVTYSSRTTTSTVDVPASSELNFTKVYYDLSGYRTDTKASSSTLKTSTFTEYSRTGTPDTFSIFKLAEAFTVIALILSFVTFVVLVVFLFDPIRNKVIFALGMTVTRLLLIFLVLLTLLSVVIAFLGFLGITEAFKQDQDVCNEGPCRKFIDSVRSEYTTEVSLNEWGAGPAWYIVLAAIPVTLLLLIVVVVNKFPLPIDSEASSGEAL